MSLATRCTACGTVFRVVQDQLRVSEGWVRCGRCAEVFNAVENLVDPPLTAPSATTGSAGSAGSAPLPGRAGPSAAMVRMGSGSPAPSTQRPGDRDGRDGRNGRAAPDDDLDLPPDSDAAQMAAPDGGSDFRADPDDRYGASSLPPSGFEGSVPPTERAAAQAHPDGISAERAAQTTQPAGEDRTRRTGGSSNTGENTQENATGRGAQPLPGFIRQADRAARWQQPRVRAGLAAVVLLGLLGLLAQAAHSYRDVLAARWPAAQPLLAQACGLLGCTVQPPRLIDALVVDSSGLVRVERSSVYKLSVTLRNQDVLAVALPALDLSLTDTQGRLVARRVLTATELGLAQTSLAAGAELVLQATLQTPDAGASAVVAGYTIDLFYP